MQEQRFSLAIARVAAACAAALLLAACTGPRPGEQAGGDPYAPGAALSAPDKPPAAGAQPGGAGGSAGSGSAAGGSGAGAPATGGTNVTSPANGASKGDAPYVVDPQPLPGPVAAVVNAPYTTARAVLTRWDGKRYLVVAAGERPTGGYSVQFRSVRREGGAWVVEAAVQGPPPGAMVTQAITYPRRAVALPDDGNPVRVTLDGKSLQVTEQPATKS